MLQIIDKENPSLSKSIFWFLYSTLILYFLLKCTDYFIDNLFLSKLAERILSWFWKSFYAVIFVANVVIYFYSIYTLKKKFNRDKIIHKSTKIKKFICVEINENQYTKKYFFSSKKMYKKNKYKIKFGDYKSYSVSSFKIYCGYTQKYLYTLIYRDDANSYYFLPESNIEKCKKTQKQIEENGYFMKNNKKFIIDSNHVFEIEKYTIDSLEDEIILK